MSRVKCVDGIQRDSSDANEGFIVGWLGDRNVSHDTCSSLGVENESFHEGWGFRMIGEEADGPQKSEMIWLM
jgi:hypothetical protein